MKDKNLISVVIPVYNAEEYLENTLESVCRQTIFKSLEIILVDDGSTDRSLKICKDFKKKYDNIKVLSKKNGGVSSARNLGLKNASGKYITFLDSDDYVEASFYEEELKIIENTKSDIVVVDFYKVHADGKKVKYRENLSYILDDKTDMMKEFFSGIIGNQVVDKIFNSEVLKNISFSQEYKIGEDMKFMCEALLNSKRVTIDTRVCGYLYIVREGSAMTGSFSRKYFDPVRISREMCLTFKNNSELSAYAEAHLVHESCKVMEYVLRHDAVSCCKEEYENVRGIVNGYSLIKAKKYLILKQFLGLILMRISPKLYLFVHKLMRIG